tara:strand:- start:401 stop:628 length:228 start_codon:yes stop_codon:yes gene_type:complete
MKTYTTSDLPVAAFLMMRGLSLVRADRGMGRFIFELEDPDDRAANLAIEYLNSDFCKFDNYIRNLKSVLYQNKKP